MKISALCSVILSIGLVGIQSRGAVDRVIPDHPLKVTILELAQASDDLKKIEDVLGREDEFKKQINESRIEISESITRAVLDPLNAVDNRIKSIGFDYSADIRGHELKANENYLQLLKSTDDLQSSKWIELKTALRTSEKMSNAAYAFGSLPLVRDAMGPSGVKLAQRNVGRSTMAVEFEIEDKLQCIDYFKKKYANSGLVPVTTGLNQVRFDGDELQRVYGVRDILNLPQSQRAAVKKSLSDMASSASICLSEAKQAFFSTQRDSIQ